MICLKCGYCCKYLAVTIVNHPEKGLKENNFDFQEGTGKSCKHLRGSKPGEYSCILHDKPWYKQTPCYAYMQEGTQVKCRIGEGIMAGKGFKHGLGRLR